MLTSVKNSRIVQKYLDKQGKTVTFIKIGKIDAASNEKLRKALKDVHKTDALCVSINHINGGQIV